MLHELALFAGVGGGILGGKLLGWRTVCAVEVEPYAASVLLARQNDGILEAFPIWDDVRTFDGKPWRALVDVVSAGFPCQDISLAGKGAGLDGARSGLWWEAARIIREVCPRHAFLENSSALTKRGLDRVLGALAEMGYDAEWCVLGADDVGAPHIRKRIWILAYAQCERLRDESGRCSRKGRASAPKSGDNGAAQYVAYTPEHGRQPRWTGISSEGPERRKPDRGGEQGDVSDTYIEHGNVAGYGAGEVCREREEAEVRGSFSKSHGQRLEEQRGAIASKKEYTEPKQCDWWTTEPGFRRVVNGFPARVDRIKACGNGQVPAVAALAWNILWTRISH